MVRIKSLFSYTGLFLLVSVISVSAASKDNYPTGKVEVGPMYEEIVAIYNNPGPMYQEVVAIYEKMVQENE